VLDAQGDPNAVFVFQVGTTLTTAAGSSVRVANSGQQRSDSQAPDPRAPSASLCHVYWQVADSATIGKDSKFVGTIIAQRAVGVGANAGVDGRTFARSGTVTLDSDSVQIPVCAAVLAAFPAAAAPLAVLPGGVVGVFGPAALIGGVAAYSVLSDKPSKSPN
jgi:hypothetical protein